jgi:DNA repair protein RadC
MTVQSEGATPYRVRRAEDEDLIRQALAILDARLRTTDEVFISKPEDTRTYLRLKLAEREAEVFCVLFLTNRHSVIAPMDGVARTVATRPKFSSQGL